MGNIVVVEIDMRKDFSDQPDAALPVNGCLGIVGYLRVVESKGDIVIEIHDSHKKNDPEFEDYPPHCVSGTWGHQRIDGLPKSDFRIPKTGTDVWDSAADKNIKLMESLFTTADKIIVGGVVTGICVDAFVKGAIERNYGGKLVVIRECVANLSKMDDVKSEESCFSAWNSEGVDIVDFDAALKSTFKV